MTSTPHHTWSDAATAPHISVLTDAALVRQAYIDGTWAERGVYAAALNVARRAAYYAKLSCVDGGPPQPTQTIAHARVGEVVLITKRRVVR